MAAADRSGATVSAVLPSVTAEAVKLVLETVPGKDALLVTDGNNVYPSRAAATKYLDSYPRWFHLAGIHHGPAPRNAAIGMQLRMGVPA